MPNIQIKIDTAALADLGDKADATVKSDIETKMADLRKMMEGEDAAEQRDQGQAHPYPGR